MVTAADFVSGSATIAARHSFSFSMPTGGVSIPVPVVAASDARAGSTSGSPTIYLYLYFMTYISRSYYSIYGIVYTIDQVHSTAPGGSATGRITCTVSYKLFTV